MSENVTAERIAEIIPYSVRQIVAMARSGDLPGAVQIAKGRKWMFDEQRIRRWFKQLEIEKCQKQNQICTSVAKSGISKLKETAKQSANPLENILWPQRGNTEIGRLIS